MNWSSSRAEWSAAIAIGLVWALISALASSALLLIGGIIYGLGLAAFIAADARSRPEN